MKIETRGEYKEGGFFDIIISDAALTADTQIAAGKTTANATSFTAEDPNIGTPVAAIAGVIANTTAATADKLIIRVRILTGFVTDNLTITSTDGAETVVREIPVSAASLKYLPLEPKPADLESAQAEYEARVLSGELTNKSGRSRSGYIRIIKGRNDDPLDEQEIIIESIKALKLDSLNTALRDGAYAPYSAVDVKPIIVQTTVVDRAFLTMLKEAADTSVVRARVKAYNDAAYQECANGFAQVQFVGLCGSGILALPNVFIANVRLNLAHNSTTSNDEENYIEFAIIPSISLSPSEIIRGYHEN